MCYLETKKYLLRYLLDKDIGVVSLSGDWGTGKTYLWNDIKSEYEQKLNRDRRAAYISLFGMSHINHVKSKLISSLYIETPTQKKIFRFLKHMSTVSMDAASTKYKALSVINDLSISWLSPWYLGNRLIVIDDIERSNDTLSINDILGFISEYSSQYNTRFLLILNESQLEERKKDWKQLYEKVIDIDIKLHTTPEEAFNISAKTIEFDYKEKLKESVLLCGITNIRIIRRIIIIARLIFSIENVSELSAFRMIPSVVLFSAIKFSPSGGVDTKILSLELLRSGSLFSSKNQTTAQKEITEYDIQISRWRSIKDKLMIYGSYKFEIELIEFLENEPVARKNLKKIISEYNNNAEFSKNNEIADKVLDRLIWDLKVTDAELLTEAEQLSAIAGSLTPTMITQLATAVEKLPGGDKVAKSLVDAWIEADRISTEPSEANIYWQNLESNLHPDIIAHLKSSKSAEESTINLFDACIYVIKNRAWSNNYVTIMNSSDSNAFVNIIKNIDGDNLKYFLLGMADMVRNKDAYDTQFKCAIENFVNACKSLGSDSTNPRLSNLLKTILMSVGIKDDLRL